jgi:hypothetical protein
MSNPCSSTTRGTEINETNSRKVRDSDESF